MRLKLFFTYYGGKYRIAPKYPTPEHGTIVEPFAGSAGYSLLYPDRNVILCDLNERVCGVWDYLIKAKEQEILDLPNEFEDLRNTNLTQEQKWLIGFWCNKGSAEPRNMPSTWMKSGIRPNSYWGDTIKQRISSQLKHIRHWQIKNCSYTDLENIEATWFIDPPYSTDAGRLYTYSDINYEQLAKFCLERKGQKIVCEAEGASWLPFQIFTNAKANPGSKGKKYSREVVWIE